MTANTINIISDNSEFCQRTPAPVEFAIDYRCFFHSDNTDE